MGHYFRKQSSKDHHSLPHDHSHIVHPPQPMHYHRKPLQATQNSSSCLLPDLRHHVEPDDRNDEQLLFGLTYFMVDTKGLTRQKCNVSLFKQFCRQIASSNIFQDGWHLINKVFYDALNFHDFVNTQCIKSKHLKDAFIM